MACRVARCNARFSSSHARPAASPSAPVTVTWHRLFEAPHRHVRASSCLICSTMARDSTSASGSRSRWLCRCCSTWRSVSAMKPRLARSPSRAATSPMPNAPAYHNGLSRLVRPPSASIRCCVQARWSASSRAACTKDSRNGRRTRAQRLRVVHRLGADLADVIDAHQRRRFTPLRLRQRSGGACTSAMPPPDSRGSLADPRPECASARSAAAINWSSGLRRRGFINVA